MAIITTAVENIAQECCSYDRNNIVIVKRLQEDQSKKLFVDTAFGSAEGCSPQFNDVIDKITRKCGGLPLAITCTARFVGRNQLVTEKKQLLDYVNTFLHDNLRTHSSSKEILNQVLKLCYSSLPHCLKTCLLYLSVYPENYSFLKEDLVKQWIAEDFICTQEKKESVALSYFELLLNLGLIQRMDIFNSKRKRLLYYTVHPMVFDFVTSKSMEENFVRIIDYSQSKMVLTEKIRRLSLHFGGATYATIPAGVGLSQVRTLGFMGLLGCLPSIEKFELVRVLILHLRGDDGNERSPLIDICKLRLLRYLQVRSNATLELPGQMQCLEHLETLDINAEVSAVPSNTLHNQRLTHIRLGRKTKQKNMPQGPVTPSQIIFPENLVYRKLPQDVQVFELLPPICSFSRLPGTIGQLTKLRILEVVVRELGTYDLDLLGKLEALTVLSLYVRKPATQRTTFHTSKLSFPSLEYFKFVSGLVLLYFPEKAMPKLWKLKIYFNARGGEKYSNMLRGIHHLEKLQEVVARIGTANGDEDSDFRKAAESAFEQAIQELERMRSNGQIRHNVKWVDKVDEEYDPPESSNKWGEISEEIQNEESTEQHDGELRTADRTHNPLPPVKDDAAPIPTQNKILRRLGQASDENSMYLHSLPGAVNVLEKLGALMEEKHVLLWGIRKHIRYLRWELYALCDTIRSRECRKNFNLHFRARPWFNRCCDLAYDIEDWADLLALRIHVDDRSRVGSSSWISQLYHRTVGMLRTKRIRNIISDIKDLVVRVDHLSRYALDLKISVDLEQQLIKFEPQEIMPHDRPTQLVGHKRPMDEVINMLMDASNVAGFKIVSIVGMAGSGKTTLAEAVYQRIKGEFDSCVFFSVGYQGTLETTLEGILRQVEMKVQESKNIQQNITKLRKLLEANRYLIVLDDLWRLKDWGAIENCFPRDNLHSRIIVTTRNDALALRCCSGLTDCIYKIGLLSDVDSKQLFHNEVFGTGHSCPKNLEIISAQILEKCGGLPLAIVTAAGILAQGQSEDERRTIGLKMLSSSDSSYMWQRLNLSYNDLPPILKSCMLYLSIFPECNLVDVERLVRLWIAEGFIIKEDRRAIEETAVSYLNMLISRNMVLPLHVNHHGIPKYCMVHPVMHDFIVQKAMEEKFIAILNDQHQDVANNYGSIRRLSMQRSSKQDQNVAQDGSMDLSHVRSIIVIGQANTVPRFADLSLVRILDLEGCDGMAAFLHGLNKLPLLRYLSLRGTGVRELPKAIEESRFLQTLDVRYTNVKMLPLSIVRLERLMHLLCGRAKLPHEISKMYGLHTLSCDFAIEYMGIGAISELE
ncbi:hypothetical protein U9M48_001806 [Paspalum notatum var. saurae]|uniref:AAA+ ATPase domain-containing protein n=1 Tax=Paspalum notatum var. saurae TaxID=547442 RepID=A0AAQ3PG83_PASNO